jgi:pyruvate-formate lyase-activating enzyme
MDPNGMPVVLSPFVPTLAEAVTAALRDLLGIPTHLPLRWHERRVDPWQLEVMVGDVAVRLQAPGSEPAFFTGERVAIAHQGGAAPTLLRALARRLRHLERDGAQLDALHAALRAWRPFAGIQDTEFRNVSDMEAILRVGFRCNQDCGFCWQGRDWPGAPRALLERWIDEMAAAGVRQLTISGGEPTVYGELLDLVRRARAAGLRLLLQTNAIRMAKPGFTQDLVDAGVDGLIVSYHAADSALSDLLTRAPGTHVRTEAGIRASLRAGMRVGLNCVVSRQNLSHLPATAERIVAEFLPLARRPLTVSFSNQSEAYEPADGSPVPLDEVAGPLAAAVRILITAGVPVQAVGSCGFPPCVLRDVPEMVVPLSLERIAPEHFASRRKPDVCTTCALVDDCVGPRDRDLRLFGTRGLVPFAERPRGEPSPLAFLPGLDDARP